MKKKEQLSFSPTEKEIEIQKIAKQLTSEKNVLRIYKRAVRLLHPDVSHLYLTYLSTENSSSIVKEQSTNMNYDMSGSNEPRATSTKEQLINAHTTLLSFIKDEQNVKTLVEHSSHIYNKLQVQTEIHLYSSRKNLLGPFTLLDYVLRNELYAQIQNSENIKTDKYSPEEKKALLAVTLGLVQTILVDEVHDSSLWPKHEHKREKVRKRALRDLVINHARVVLAKEKKPDLIAELAQAKK